MIPKHLMFTSDQTELTPEQLEEAKKYAQEKIQKYLSCKHEPKKVIETYVVNAYKVAGLTPPKKIRWFKSPDSVRTSAGASVGDSVSLWASMRDSVGASMWASMRAYFDADEWSYLGFYHKYFKQNNIIWMQLLSENVSGYFFYKNECWLVEKPKTLLLENNKLHSIKGKAIEWKDGYGFYFLHGVNFDKKLWKQVTGKPHIKTILTIENMEQRMAALKVVGVDKIIKN